MGAVSESGVSVVPGPTERNVSGRFTRWLDELMMLERGYYAVDGAAGAMLLALLPGADTRLRSVATPRHADVLIVVEPVTAALLGAIVEVYRQMPSPRRIVVVGPGSQSAEAADLRLEDYLPVSAWVDLPVTAPSAAAIVAAAVRRTCRPEVPERRASVGSQALAEQFVPLRSVAEREMATEDLVVSLGPVQAATAGPLQLLLTLDGEHVERVDVRSGYAHSGVEKTQLARRWDAGVSGVEIDPLTPVAVQLAWTLAFERLHAIVPSAATEQQRTFALQVERAASQFIWLTRFADLVGFQGLADNARELATLAVAHVPSANAARPAGGHESHVRRTTPDELEHLSRAAHRLVSRLERDRQFAIRTRGVGVLSAAHARTAGASGAVLYASESGYGDTRTRALARLSAAAADFANSATLARSIAGEDSNGTVYGTLPDSPPPVGTATVRVDGPRGVLSLTIESSGGERPARVTWNGPSRAHLALIPELVLGLTVPEVLVCVASLDLSMAEADG